MEHISSFEKFVNENLALNEDIIIQVPGGTSVTSKERDVSPEFLEWYEATKKKAEEMRWNDWGYSFADKSVDPQQNKVLFMVSVKAFEKPVQKGIFRKDTKKGEISED